MDKLIVFLIVVSLALSSCVYLLFQRCQRLEEELCSARVEMRQEIKDAQLSLRSVRKRATARDDRISSLGAGLDRMTDSFAQEQDANNDLRRDLDSMAEDVAAGVQSHVTQEVVASSVAQAVAQVVGGRKFLSDQIFLREVADLLAQEHRESLRGLPGADASNEVLASLLKQDADFLNAVSLSVLADQ